MARVFIMAEAFSHAVTCARQMGFRQNEWTFLDDPNKLRGTRGARIIKYESHWMLSEETHNKIDHIARCSDATIEFWPPDGDK